jgi:hypothetical protein
VEEFNVWKIIGAADYGRLPARVVDAIFTLENELRMERGHAEE